VETALDRQGRIPIPPSLREFARLEALHPVIVLGVKDRIELWQPDAWREHAREILTHLRDAFTVDGPVGL